MAVSSYGNETSSSVRNRKNIMKEIKTILTIKLQGAVKIVMDLRTDIENKHVIIVEDIIDTGTCIIAWQYSNDRVSDQYHLLFLFIGLTMKFLLNLLSSRKPASVQVCSLLRKQGTQKVELDLKYIGFDIPKDAFVVGYGLDYAGM